MKKVDLTGKRFGKLQALKRLGSVQTGGRKFARWLCVCDCGNLTKVRTGHLTKPNGTRSCGCLQVSHPLPKGEGQFNQVFASYRRQARGRNYSFELTKDEFRELVSSNCHYCDSPPTSVQSQVRANGDFVYNGVDRMDNSKGYSVENCVPCCKLCNFMKRDLTVDQFLEHIKKIMDNTVV